MVSSSDEAFSLDDLSVQKSDKLTIKQILSAENIVSLLDKDKLTDISKQVSDDYTKDLSSCDEKMQQLQDLVKFAKMSPDQKDTPWEGCSNFYYPLIAQAANEFGSTLYPEIIKDSSIVKAKIIGKDEGTIGMSADGPMIDPQTGKPVMVNAGAKKKKGDRVSTYMNYQLTDEMSYWETDVDKLGNALPVLGNLYKKIYWDSLNSEAVSELIFPDKIVINNGARDIKSAVVTHVLELYPQEIMQRIRSGFYMNFDYDYALDKTDQTDPDIINNIGKLDESDNYGNNTKLNTFLEQHTWLDLDKDNFPEPYIVTINSQTNDVVRLVPRYTEKDIQYNTKGEIKYIKAKQYFVKYGFIPSPDGSFFDEGFGSLLESLNDGINSTLNQLFDAGHQSITGGGFLSKEFKRKMGRIAVNPGEWLPIDVMGEDLQKSIYPIPRPEPNPTLFAMLGYLVDAGKSLGMLRDVLTGEAMGNVQATTQISMVEQGLKQFKAIYKRFYKSLKEELKLIYEINFENLDNAKYAQVLDEDTIDVDVKMDFDSKGYDICPVADIEAVTSYQRMAQANFYMQFIGNPIIDQTELLKRVFSIASIDDPEKLILPPSPPVNPLLEIEQLKAQVKMQELQADTEIKTQQLQIEVQKGIASIEKMQAEIEKLHTSSMVDLANVAKTGNDINDAAQEREVKVMDNMIDAGIKKIEVAGRIRTAELKHASDVMKLHHEANKMNEPAAKSSETNP